MNTSVLLPVIAWLSTALASPTPLETLNYSGIKPPVYPPDGGCIIVARLYRKVDGLRVWDSAPICTPDAIDFPSVTQDYVDHAPPDIQSGTLQWAAYGWIFPEDKSADSIGRPGCVWVDAKLDTPCVAEHSLLPDDMVFPNPFQLAWYSSFWTMDRKVSQKIECTSSSSCGPVD